MQASATLGDYQIIREIGRGGMGVVHLARQRCLGRLVALKILPAEFTSDPLRLERFHREAEVISRLDHPSIVPVFSVGEDGGTHYIAMKFLEGETLDRVIFARRPPPAPAEDGAGDSDTLVLPREEGVPPPEERRRPERPAIHPKFRAITAESEPGWVSRILRIGEKVARALHHAHDQGVIHRDVKPGNILLDAHGHPWLLDFGLVRDLSGDSLTHTDNFLGTAWYMAPEQIRHDRGPADHRVDVYALAVTLYELLTSRRPFDYRSPDTLFHAIVNEEPVPPRRLNPRLPRDVDTVLLKAMSKRSADRYATAEAFADDLRRVRGFEPIVARPETATGRARRWVRRNPALAAAILFGVLSFVGMIEVSVYRDILDERRRSAALESADEAYDHGSFRDALDHYDLYVMLGGDEDVIAPRLHALRRLLDRRPPPRSDTVRSR